MHAQVQSHAYDGHAKQHFLLEACRDLARGITEKCRDWRRRARVRNELTTLSDRDLRELRWTRVEVEAEACKPFWRA